MHFLSSGKTTNVLLLWLSTITPSSAFLPAHTSSSVVQNTALDGDRSKSWSSLNMAFDDSEQSNMFDGPLPLTKERDACGVGFVANPTEGELRQGDQWNFSLFGRRRWAIAPIRIRQKWTKVTDSSNYSFPHSLFFLSTLRCFESNLQNTGQTKSFATASQHSPAWNTEEDAEEIQFPGMVLESWAKSLGRS